VADGRTIEHGKNSPHHTEILRFAQDDKEGAQDDRRASLASHF